MTKNKNSLSSKNDIKDIKIEPIILPPLKQPLPPDKDSFRKDSNN